MATGSMTQTDCKPPKTPEVVCPDCGALECLCRPRFFAGQLLSEQDLNRLDRYIKKKSQLHNRSLHGWGVVNGLMVLCDPCGGIKLTKGYAVDPCGEDVVVCKDTEVPICDLIRKCKELERADWQCKPFQRPPAQDCGDLEEEWVLAIRYCELPSRGITALRSTGCTCGKSPAACSCGGGAGSCGCGTPEPGGQPRGAPPECEPTIICEGYAFDVYRKPEPEDPVGTDHDADGLLDDFEFEGPLYERFMCCWNALQAAIPTPPRESAAENPIAWQQWCCQLRQNLMNYFHSNDSTNCLLADALACISCPNPNEMSAEAFATRLEEVVNELINILLEALVDCLCLALLPPAPEATADPRIPLATVRVRVRDCKIISVCNWTTEREIMVTWPAIRYWLSLIPIGKWLHEALDQICCAVYARPTCEEPEERQPDDDVVPDDSGAVGPIDAAASANMRLNPAFHFEEQISTFAKLASLSASRKGEFLNSRSFLNGTTRLNLKTKAPGLEKIESRNIPQLLLMNMVARPLWRAALHPAALGRVMSVVGVTDRPGGAADTADLTERIASLEKKLVEQDKTLKELRRELENEG